ncbi:MAG: CbtA family protein [Candidatus Nitrosopelagicus sp.]|nr:CbtA family protein [Candidatus Nitrosopelagicus sp.]
MKTALFIIIVLLSGCFAGMIYGGLNLVIVEPYLDDAINIENQNLFSAGEETDGPQFWVEYYEYRSWQKGGEMLAGAIFGISIGSLFGIVYALSKKSLPSKNNISKTLILAGLMWFTLFVIPFLKYPANPPTVGDGETVVLRGILYLTLIAISGLMAIGFYQIFKRLKNKNRVLPIIGYSMLMCIVFFIMPDNPDKISTSMELINGFRAVAFLTNTVFWFTLALLLGIFWQKTNPDLSNT